MRRSRFFIFLMLVPLLARAGGKIVGNGGDSRAIEFTGYALAAITDVEQNILNYPEIQKKPLLRILSRAHVLVSDFKLQATGEMRLYPSAINYHHPDTIVLYGPRWSVLQNNLLKKALALHEVLGLADVEGSGDYRISSRYLNSLGFDCAQGICDRAPTYVCGLLRKKQGAILSRHTRQVSDIETRMNRLTLGEGPVKAVVTMTMSLPDPFISFFIYDGANVAASLHLEGTAFPPSHQLSWQDFVRGETYTLTCDQE